MTISLKFEETSYTAKTNLLIRHWKLLKNLGKTKAILNQFR